MQNKIPDVNIALGYKKHTFLSTNKNLTYKFVYKPYLQIVWRAFSGRKYPLGYLGVFFSFVGVYGHVSRFYL